MLENLDYGGEDLIASIISLAEHGYSELPNGHRVQMHCDCRIFATISLDLDHSQSLQQLLRDYPYTVNMPSMDSDNLTAILCVMMDVDAAGE